MILGKDLLCYFERVMKDLEKYGAKVKVIATLSPDVIEIDYTIEATFPDGEKWEIIDISRE